VPYSTLATSATPALIVYLLDVSSSMGQNLAGKTRIEAVAQALSAALQQMIFRSTKGALVAPRYRIAMYAYSDKVYDVLGGVRTIDEVARWGVPDLKPLRTTETAQGFAQAERLLLAEIPHMLNCPAPLVCHMTDGEYTGVDPEPIVRDIKSLSVPDGGVLVENIFISDGLLGEPVGDSRTWAGVEAATPLANGYGNKLRVMSSPLPASYRAVLNENDYALSESAVMMLPGETLELVSLGFQMSAATPTRRIR
jgi:hypothetical protein